jgi:hypothetical protein
MESRGEMSIEETVAIVDELNMLMQKDEGRFKSFFRL